jgi:hypothetical protein
MSENLRIKFMSISLVFEILYPWVLGIGIPMVLAREPSFTYWMGGIVLFRVLWEIGTKHLRK